MEEKKLRISPPILEILNRGHPFVGFGRNPRSSIRIMCFAYYSLTKKDVFYGRWIPNRHCVLERDTCDGPCFRVGLFCLLYLLHPLKLVMNNTHGRFR